MSTETVLDKLQDQRWWLSSNKLTRSEWEAAGSITSPTARLRHLCGRILARQAIADRTGIAASDIEIAIDRSGKPYLVGQAIEFNISHSAELVAVSTSQRPVGIDVECLKRRVNWRAISTQHFSQSEADWIAARPALSTRRFLALWTLKEAYLKALGVAVPLGDLAFIPHTARTLVGRSAAGPASICQFYRARPGFVVAVSCLNPLGSTGV
ncbi:MAG: 4'-phosphopantetheinyl transferase superfamily protein [Pseudoruegeria sp.]